MMALQGRRRPMRELPVEELAVEELQMEGLRRFESLLEKPTPDASDLDESQPEKPHRV
jgi:hypothetical protein